MYKKSLVIAVSLLSIVGCSPITIDPSGSVNSSNNSTTTSDAISTPTQSTDTTSSINSQFTQQSYLDAINNARAIGRSCGSYGYFGAVSALSWNDNLYSASNEHSQDMADTSNFSHTGSNTSSDTTAQALNLGTGSTLRDRLEYNGYENKKTWGENIAAGNSTLDETIDQWLTSDGHCANMMSPDFTEVGMSHAENPSSEYRHYWTQTFGARF